MTSNEPSERDAPRRGASQPLKLCDALLDLQFGHAAATPAQRRNSAAAAQLLLSFLTPIARGLQARFRGVFEADDLTQELLIKLAQRGPMRGRANAPATDVEAERLLRRSALNLALDRRRSHKAHRRDQAISLSPGDADRAPVDPASDAQGADVELEAIERGRDESAQIAAADRTLDAIERDLCTSRDARRAGTGRELAAQLQLLGRAASGELDVGDLARQQLRDEGGDPNDSKALAKARNAIDARFKRGRAAMTEALDAWILAQTPSATLAELLRLRLRRRIALQGQEAAPASEAAPAGRRQQRGQPGRDDRGTR